MLEINSRCINVANNFSRVCACKWRNGLDIWLVELIGAYSLYSLCLGAYSWSLSDDSGQTRPIVFHKCSNVKARWALDGP